MTVLASALDWGLGHTTRCIPIFKELIKQGFTLIIAGNPSQITILKSELPEADFIEFPGYNIHYSGKKSLFTLSIISQLPRIITTIAKEKKWVKSFAKTRKIDIIFSDNRPGFRTKRIHSIYMTHQLSVKAGNYFTSRIASLLHLFFIKKFNECWVPDMEANGGLSGYLSHGRNKLKDLKFIGPLSRFEKLQTNKTYSLAIILSGPEPSRTIFEKLLSAQLIKSDNKTILVRGLPGEENIPEINKNMIVKNHLESTELNKVISSSELILCRSGYSSIMDLALTQSKAVLIPTPGQGEQEYLARYLSKNEYFMSASQHNISLASIVEKSKRFPFKAIDADFRLFKVFIHGLKEKKY